MVVINVCDYCKITPKKLKGIHLPSDFDDREDSRDGKVFVAKCDACSIYDSDAKAAEVIAKETGWTIFKSYDSDESTDAENRDMHEPSTTWERNDIQFPRLIAAIKAVGLGPEQVRDLCASMDITTDELHELFDCAEEEFEAMKPPYENAR